MKVGDDKMFKILHEINTRKMSKTSDFIKLLESKLDTETVNNFKQQVI